METTPTTQKHRKLTKKQRGFVKDYAETENGTEAALKNYNLKSNNKYQVASVIASENLDKPYLVDAIDIERKSLKQALIDKGITEDCLADKVDILLNATDEKGFSDYNAIDKGLKHATNIYGVTDDNKKPESVNTYNFIFSKEVQSDVKKLEDSIKEKLLNHVPKN